MSVVIKGMDMPECCEVCPCYDWIEDICRITESPNDFSDTRIEDCPLVDIATPHGRLIDADVVCSNIDNELSGSGSKWLAERAVHDAPTIIEAEDGE